MFREHENIVSRIDADIAARARDGVWGVPLTLAMVFGTTTVLLDHPLAMGAFGLAALLQTGVRMFLLRRVPGPGEARAGIWRRRLLSTLMLSAAIWGLLPAWACLVYGFHDPNTILMLLYFAAIAVVGAPIFVYDLRLACLWLALLFIPLMLAHGFFPDKQRWGPLWALAAYGVFLYFRVRKLCAEYRRMLDENRVLAVSATRDSLTGLANREAMRRAISRAIEYAAAASGRIAVLFIDLDGFKSVNDRASHRVGDLLLCEIAGRIAQCIGQTGSVARVGGDEFIVVLPGESIASSRESAVEIAHWIVGAIRSPVTIEGDDYRVGASLGISFYPEDGVTYLELVRAADHAMYEAKRKGKNQICFAGARREEGLSENRAHSVAAPRG